MQLRVRISKDGKITIPSTYRKILKIKNGDEMLLNLKDNSLILSSVKGALEKARQIVNQHFSSEVSLVDQLITERREEANRE